MTLKLLGVLLLFSTVTYSQNNINSKKGVAIDGYDPVSYFEGEPKEGSEQYNVVENGVTYYFISEKNKLEFTSNPNKYKPQYGGWCAYAMGETGEKVKVDPETFKIINGKLYLFYNFRLTNTLDYWNKNENQLKSKADNNWASLKAN